MPRFKLTIEYAGTRYSGWQIQKNARTIQGEIDRAVRTVTGRKDFELYGSGRTDAGVHALGQVAHLDVVTSLTPAALVQRLNDELPEDINILDAVPVPHRFHARHHAVARRYLYQIARRRDAADPAYVWWVKERLDVDKMRDAARAFVGMRDFRAFAVPAARGEDEPPPSTRVLVDAIDIVGTGRSRVGAGPHFLWKMVRRGRRAGRDRPRRASGRVRTMLAAGSQAARLTRRRRPVSRKGVLRRESGLSRATSGCSCRQADRSWPAFRWPSELQRRRKPCATRNSQLL
jgi:tRNA pseudouridine38-40 synthase